MGRRPDAGWAGALRRTGEGRGWTGPQDDLGEERFLAVQLQRSPHGLHRGPGREGEGEDDPPRVRGQVAEAAVVPSCTCPVRRAEPGSVTGPAARPSPVIRARSAAMATVKCRRMLPPP
ncbi:hypothetical protein [Symbiobacterium thermophilum]|uniref:Uncharacterized protein n=1 Tax=Symbiobacterium thermophilum TaxID=2734 RepID=A0A953LIT3_SYMTR|nr:hypothetical protein [Symbiobacterium thermophilum]MBY6277611.1 hypothetical protein [Symbiobacterium thermophilum]